MEATRIHADAVAEADEMIARAKDEGRALLEQVQAARKRVLADMSTRRRALSIQIEQLRAARDRDGGVDPRCAGLGGRDPEGSAAQRRGRPFRRCRRPGTEPVCAGSMMSRSTTT